MNLLNRRMDYALLILCYLHHKPAGGSAREIAAHFNLSRPFVANILKDLCHLSFVVSERGVKGGYVIGETTSGITLADLMDSMAEHIHLAQCNEPEVADSECCTLAETCPIRGPIGEVNARIRNVLQSVTLAELFVARDACDRSVTLETTRCQLADCDKNNE